MNDTARLFHHILVPTDGSQTSNTAGQLAVQIAGIHQASLTFVYVIDDSVVEKLMRSLRQDRETVTRNLRHSGQQYLDHLEHLTRHTDLESHKVICQGNPWHEIDRLARSEGIDLIVMGQVGRSLGQRMVIGPVAERVIEITACPVLVVK